MNTARTMTNPILYQLHYKVTKENPVISVSPYTFLIKLVLPLLRFFFFLFFSFFFSLSQILFTVGLIYLFHSDAFYCADNIVASVVVDSSATQKGAHGVL